MEYIERFGLRQLLQELFQKVIKERPEDPFNFMQAHLCLAGCTLPEGKDAHHSKQVLQGQLKEQQLHRHKVEDKLKHQQQAISQTLPRQPKTTTEHIDQKVSSQTSSQCNIDNPLINPASFDHINNQSNDHLEPVDQLIPVDSNRLDQSIAPPTELQQPETNNQQHAAALPSQIRLAEEGKWSEVSEQLQEQERQFTQLLEQRRLEVQILQQQALDAKQQAEHHIEEKHLLVESLFSRLQALESAISRQTSALSTTHLESKAERVTTSQIEDQLDFFQPDSSSSVQNIAATLEAQRKTISALSTRLDVESRRREAAELHALTIDEAFEALQRKLNVDLNLSKNEAVEEANVAAM